MIKKKKVVVFDLKNNNRIIKRETMAITYKNFDINNVIFENVKQMTTPSEIKFQRVFLKYKYDDGTIDKISIQTPTLYSYGIQENRSPQTDLVDSYTLRLTM